MSIIINFLEELKVESIYDNQIELSFSKDILFINKGIDYYYFMFAKVPNFSSNLCREIVMVSEKQHDFKIKKTDNELSHYLDCKINKKEMKEFLENDEQELIELFEDKLKSYSNLSSLFLTIKLSNNLESKKNHRKSKI